MKYTITISDNYFCCSTLPLLNGDIKGIIQEFNMTRYNSLENVLKSIIEHLENELSISKLGSFKFRNIKKEYKRLLQLNRFRLKNLKWYESEDDSK